MVSIQCAMIDQIVVRSCGIAAAPHSLVARSLLSLLIYLMWLESAVGLINQVIAMVTERKEAT